MRGLWLMSEPPFDIVRCSTGGARAEELSTAGAFREAMSNFPAAVAVVATGSEDGRRGFTATSVFSVSMAPPMVGVCVNKAVEAHAPILENQAFCVNILSRDQEAIANRFAARDGSKGSVRFEHEPWEMLDSGSPVLQDCLTSVDCRLTAYLDVGTHTVLFGLVLAVGSNTRKFPLLYYDRRFLGVAGYQRDEVPIVSAPIDGW